MNLTRKMQDEKLFLQFDGDISIAELSEVHKSLTPCVQRCQELTLDLQGVTDCDTAGIQLIVSLILSTKSANKQISMEGISPALIESARRVGIGLEGLLSSSEVAING